VESFLWINDQEKRNLMKELYLQAREDRVPILQDEAAKLIDSWLLLHQPKEILEVGAAIGYSAIRMALVCPDVKIQTIERDPERIVQAKKYFHQFGFDKNITLHEGDALELIKTLDEKFDLVFIDAAKGQYGRFFEDAYPLVRKGGAIICDNMLFHGMLESDDVPKRYKTMVKRLKAFHATLLNHPELETRILAIDDGVSISIKKED